MKSSMKRLICSRRSRPSALYSIVSPSLDASPSCSHFGLARRLGSGPLEDRPTRRHPARLLAHHGVRIMVAGVLERVDGVGVAMHLTEEAGGLIAHVGAGVL